MKHSCKWKQKSFSISTPAHKGPPVFQEPISLLSLWQLQSPPNIYKKKVSTHPTFPGSYSKDIWSYVLRLVAFDEIFDICIQSFVGLKLPYMTSFTHVIIWIVWSAFIQHIWMERNRRRLLSDCLRYLICHTFHACYTLNSLVSLHNYI